MVWANYEYAWGGRYTHHYTTQSLNGYDILEHELQPIRFQGQYYDPETSLHYNRFRYYDSDVGMFIQRDPIGLFGGLNTFQYAPNPIHWIDVLGLSTVYLRNKEFYVGKAKQNAKGRYGNKNTATDIFTNITDTNVAQGVEQIVYEEMKKMFQEGILPEDLKNKKRPVNMDNKKKVYRRDLGLNWLLENFGENYIDEIRKRVKEHYQIKDGCT